MNLRDIWPIYWEKFKDFDNDMFWKLKMFFISTDSQAPLDH